LLDYRPVRAWKLALPLAVLLTYAPSLDGTFLNYDDGWLIGKNKIVAAPLAQAMPRIWTDLSFDTRWMLGGEFLPVRDVSVWFDVHVLGGSPRVLRSMNLALYLMALMLLGGTLRRLFPRDGAVAELALWLFALHPVHAESVAWIAGRKDVLALLFLSAALFVHARDRRHGVVTVPALLALAMLSKSLAVVGPLLLPIVDMGRRRPVAWRTALLSLAAVAPIVFVQVGVGRTMGLIHTPLGGDRLSAAASMGPVFAHYLVRSFVPLGLSVAYDVRVLPVTALGAWLGYAPLGAWLALGAWAWRTRDRRTPLLAALWFVVTLAPTSQVLVPLENVQQDRYLLLAVLGPCVLMALGITSLARRLASKLARLDTEPSAQPAARGVPGALRRYPAPVLAAPLVLFFGARALDRGLAFSDSVALWQDALAKTETNTTAPYELGMALDAAGRSDEAYAAFLETTRRGPTSDNAANATAHLTRLLFARGQNDAAIALLREGVKLYPQSSKLLGNLAIVLADSPDPAARAEGRELFETLVHRFPHYEHGLRSYEARYGPVR
jgi:tetratricopeptide (TPR) repeat protein